MMAAYLKSSLAKEAQTPVPVSRQDKLKEEEELQLALAISQSEAEATKSNASSSSRSGGASSAGSERAASPKVKTYSPSGKAEEEKSDELAKYMDRAYWEKKRQEQVGFENESGKISAPVGNAPPSRADTMPRMESLASMPPSNQTPYMNGTAVNGAGESDETCNLIQHKLDMFLNRMRSNMTRGRNISQDSAVQSAFQELSNLQPVLAKLIATNEMKRNHFESQQDQLSLLKDTRETLDSMRDDHQEKLRQEKAERERQMMMQRQQKMEALRGLKQQFLLHRMQQLESERHNQQASMAELAMAQQHYPYHQAPSMVAGGPPMQQPYGSMTLQQAHQGSPYGSLNTAYQPNQVTPNIMGYQGQQPMPGGAYNMHQMSGALPAAGLQHPGQAANPPPAAAVPGQPGAYMMPGSQGYPQFQSPQPGQYSSILNAGQQMAAGAPQNAMANQQYQSMNVPGNQQFMGTGMPQQQAAEQGAGGGQMAPSTVASVPQPVATESPLIDFG